MVEVVIDLKALGLLEKIFLHDTAKQKRGELIFMAILQDLLGTGEEGDGVVVFSENLAKYLFQSCQSNAGQVLLVKSFVREVKLFPKSFSIKERFSMQTENVVGGNQDRSEVISQGSRPVEDEVAYQGSSRVKENSYEW